MYIYLKYETVHVNYAYIWRGCRLNTKSKNWLERAECAPECLTSSLGFVLLRNEYARYAVLTTE